MTNSRAYVFVLAILTCLPGYLLAQNYLQPEIITMESGLSSHHVNDVMFDQKGYLWAATRNGLNRYDGYAFKQFMTTQAPGPLQESQEIKKILTDQSGNIWFLSNTGIGMYEAGTGKISFYSKEVIDDTLTVSTELIDIYIDTQNTVWLLTDIVMISINPEMLIETYPLPQQYANLAVTCITGDESGTLWIGSNRGPIILNKQSGNFIELISGNSQVTLSHPYVKCLFIDQQSSVWIGTSKGLNRFDPVNFNIDSFYPENTGQLLPGNEILSISHHEDGVLLVVTGSGILFFDLQDEQFTDVYNVSGSEISAAISDDYGNIWAADSRGILKLRNSDLIVRNYNTISSGLKLSHNHVTALYALRDNHIWVGYKDSDFDIVNMGASGIIRKNITSDNEIKGFYSFSRDEIIVLTSHDLLLYDHNGSGGINLKDRYSFIKQDLLHNAEINCMLQDTINRIWLGTSNGLQRLQLNTSSHNIITTLKSDYDSLILSEVYAIANDAQNNLWLGTDDGLVLYNPEQKRFIKYTPYDKELLNTESKKVYTIVDETSDVFWIGTSRGVFRFDIKNREFTALNDPYLMNSAVRTITFDGYGNIWIGSDIGLYYYMIDRNSLMFYSPREGLINYAYNTSIMDARGKVYVGGEHGLSEVSITSIEPHFKYHNIVITGIYWIEKEKKEEIYYEVPDTVMIPLRKSSLQVNFAVLDLSCPENNKFSYAFVKSGSAIEYYQNVSQHYIILNPMSSGRYVFSVRGSNSNMVWNPEDTRIVIIVEAPFWRSGTAIIIYAVLFIALLIVIIIQWLRWLSRKNNQNKEKEKIAKQIMIQKEELSIKNKSITDSINYAKRIQTAMLPPFKMLKTFFPSSFILYMPKDIVSGDFYWINTMNDKTFVAAVDCTGHGVPGAFMSLIGFELFRRITNVEGLTRPSDILNKLNEDFHEIFKDVDNIVLRDGMDVALCSIDRNNNILEFSGAFNPLYLIRDNKITEIKGDRFAIGLDETNFMNQTFKNHLIPLQEGDIIYIFSDGFADQFGGPDGKKYKYRRFKHLLLNMHQLDMEKQREILENNVKEWRGQEEQVDDILIIGIKVDY